MNAVIYEVPALDHDAMMKRKYGTKVSARGKLERRIAWNLLKHLEAAGFKVTSLDDSDNLTNLTGDPKEVMELLFDLDEADIYVKKGRHHEHAIRLIFGNGIDMISDYTFAEGDADGFEALMNAFDPEECA
jgi:hypothetical protein